MSLQQQIDAAKKCVAAWPKWMRDLCYFGYPARGPRVVIERTYRQTRKK